MRILLTRLRIHEVPCKGRNDMSSTQDIRGGDETVPFIRAIWLNKFQPRDAKIREPILIAGVLLKPAHPEDLNFLSPGSTGNLLHTSVMDGDSKDVNEAAISIRVGMIIFRGSNHDVRSCAEVDDV